MKRANIIVPFIIEDEADPQLLADELGGRLIDGLSDHGGDEWITRVSETYQVGSAVADENQIAPAIQALREMLEWCEENNVVIDNSDAMGVWRIHLGKAEGLA